MARWKRIKVAPVLSAFVWGVLTGLGIDPAQMLFETAVEQFGPYLKIASVLLFIIVLYLSYSWIIEGVKRSRKAFRVAGTIGIAAIALAFLSGFYIFSWDKAVIVLGISILAWIYAIW
jgi:glucan phosphoethanolaminetransferase (alkaline phosphatase superfamily)